MLKNIGKNEGKRSEEKKKKKKGAPEHFGGRKGNGRAELLGGDEKENETDDWLVPVHLGKE